MSANRQRIRHAPKKRSGGGTWIWGVVMAVIVVVFLAALVFSKLDQPAAAKEVGTAVKVDGAPLPAMPKKGPDPAIGATAPKVSGVNPDGDPVTLGPDGRPTLMLLVTHWCPHCQNEIPRMKQYQSDGLMTGVDVQILSTSQDESRDNWPPSSWLKNKGPKGVVLADDENLGAAQAYGLTGFPTIIALDKDGKVVARASGELSQATVEKILDAARTGKPVQVDSGASSNAG